jgi:hypothetical protein
MAVHICFDKSDQAHADNSWRRLLERMIVRRIGVKGIFIFGRKIGAIVDTVTIGARTLHMIGARTEDTGVVVSTRVVFLVRIIHHRLHFVIGGEFESVQKGFLRCNRETHSCIACK